MKWARVENGVVREITDIDPTGRFVTEIEQQFISCPAEVEQGHIYTNGVFAAPIEKCLTLDEQAATIEAKYQAKFNALKERLLTARLANSDISVMQTEYTTLSDQMNTEIIALYGGVL